MKRKGILFVISGPSGAGKGTVLAGVKSEIDGFAVSVSVTTRKPREGELEGYNYYFRTREEFGRLVKEKAFLEHVSKFGNRYGTLRAEVEKHIAAGLDVVLEIETEGAAKIKRGFPEAVLIFVTPTNYGVLAERLAKRASETEENRALRLKIAEKELQSIRRYDYIAINDELDECIATVKAIILAERCRLNKHPEVAEQYIAGAAITKSEEEKKEVHIEVNI